MRAEDLRDLLRGRPFRPFRIHTTDGQTFDIRHPEMAMISRSWVDIGIEAEEGSGIADRFTYCSLIHITRIENLPTTPAGSNGNTLHQS